MEQYRKKLAAEVLGTFALVFAGTGAIVVNDVSGGAVTHVGISLTFGLIVLAMIYALGDVSGAHLNPAVTIGFFAARRLPAPFAAGYILSQCAGALLASLTLRFMFPSHATLGSTAPSGPAGQSFVLEFLLTFLLMFVILSVSTGAKEKGITAGIAVGAVIALEALFGGPISGASMNPARSLAPAVVAMRLDNLWLYLTAPVLGALAAVIAFCWIHAEDVSQVVVQEPHESQFAPIRIVFVCVENSNRSQMAEAFARIHGAGRVEAYSAGSRPSGQVNPKAIAAMRERGYDLSSHRSKSISELGEVEFDAAVTMGCGDECPNIKARQRLEWTIPDPKEMTVPEFRKVRDLIEAKVKDLISSLQSAKEKGS